MSYSAVVRIYATYQKPDYECPWQAMPPSRGTGSGVVIAPGKILTGAHVVAFATFIQVQKVSDPNKALAKVSAICHDSDLALLEVDDPEFMSGVEVPALGELPNLRDRVSVVGYPVGGEEISITEGVVSRVEVQRYSHSQRHLLAVTVDAAINRGNSGGPAFLDGVVVGIAFQALRNAKNIGELVPTPVIRQFLDGIAASRIPEVPGLSIRTQNLENPLLRKRAGIGSGESGVLITAVDYAGSSWGVLELGDALLSIDGMPISNNGTVQYQGLFRTSFDVVLGHHWVGDRIPVEVKRRGERLKLELELKPANKLVPRSAHSGQPSYFVWGGLVFQPLSLDFLQTWETWWEQAPPEFIFKYYAGLRTPDQQQLIVLTQVLADEINVGYQHLFNESVVSIGGETPKDMADFVHRVESCKDTIELRMTFGGIIALEAGAARESQQRILERYHITHDRSSDLRPEVDATGA